MFGVEGDGDADARVVFHTVALFRRGLVCIVAAGLTIGFPLDDEAAAAGGHEASEDGGEFAGDLLEGAFDCFVFALVEDVDEVADRGLRGVEFGAAGGEGVALRGEVGVLLDGFFVDVAVFLEGFVDFVEAFDGLE